MEKDSSLLDLAFKKIKSGIFDGTYPPGSKLSTQKISDSLQMSRTPVVAAINRLVAEGLAVAIPRRGVVVAKFSPGEIMEATEIRTMIEVYCVKPAIRNLDYYPEITREMHEISEELQAMTTFDVDIASKKEQRFHSLYVKLAGNERLLKYYELNLSIDAVFYFYRLVNVSSEIMISSYKETKGIYENLMARDPVALEASIRNHIQLINTTLALYLRSHGEGPLS